MYVYALLMMKCFRRESRPPCRTDVVMLGFAVLYVRKDIRHTVEAGRRWA
jgi:hypothetical protein